MTVQTDVLQVLKSTDGQNALKKALLAAVKSDDGQKALEQALKSDAGQKALEQAARAVLREGFGRLAPGHTDEEFVHPNQQWLFDTVESLSSTVNEIFDSFLAGKEKVRD